MTTERRCLTPGTSAGYNKHRCRCDDCRAWSAARRRARPQVRDRAAKAAYDRARWLDRGERVNAARRAAYAPQRPWAAPSVLRDELAAERARLVAEWDLLVPQPRDPWLAPLSLDRPVSDGESTTFADLLPGTYWLDPTADAALSSF